MSLEVYAIAGQGVATIFIAGGLVYTIVRNGRRDRKKDTELKTELTTAVNTINTQLNDPNNGLGAIRSAVERQEVNCAKISSTLAAEVKANRRDIDNLQRKRRK